MKWLTSPSYCSSTPLPHTQIWRFHVTAIPPPEAPPEKEGETTERVTAALKLHINGYKPYITLAKKSLTTIISLHKRGMGRQHQYISKHGSMIGI